MDIEAIFKDEAWAFGDLIHRVGNVSDAAGRPIGEGRAPSDLREAVPMVKKRCPYRDERLGRWMNVSALAQITDNLDEVLGDIRALRSHFDRPARWEQVYAGLASQLVAPAIHVLQHGLRVAVPVPLAVGYKVAAGYTTPVRDALVAEALGQHIPVTVAELHRRVRDKNQLVGAREVCAAPQNMLDRVTGTFLCEPGAPPAAGVDEVLLEVAELLAQQVQLGVYWELYDRAIERALLVDDVGRGRIEPRTEYVGRILDERLDSLGHEAIDLAAVRLTASLDEADRVALMRAVKSRDAGVPADALATVRTAASDLDGALRIPGDLATGVVAERFAAYISAYCTFLRVSMGLEQRMRRAVTAAASAPGPVKVAAMLPLPRSLRWLELMVGYRLRFGESMEGEVLLRSPNHTYRLPAALWAPLP